jgi:hypothetical protein
VASSGGIISKSSINILLIIQFVINLRHGINRLAWQLLYVSAGKIKDESNLNITTSKKGG